jgi:hypothetical protein
LPESVKEYHYGEVYGLTQDGGMGYVTLPNGYSTIDIETFYGTSLRKIDLPSTMR